MQHYRTFGREPAAFLATLPETLDYTGEFGTELVVFLPFVTWLHENGILARHKLRLYRGMRCFYDHVAPKEFIEKSEPRVYVRRRDRVGLPIRNEDTFDNTFTRCPLLSYPDFRSRFAQQKLACDLREDGRPLLVIHNKYNKEWNFGRSVNHITPGALDETIGRLKSQYRIVYIRHGMRSLPQTYSHDHNAMLDDLADQPVLARHPEVMNYEDLFEEHVRNGGADDMNLVKNAIYARSYHFISAQGGGTYQCAYFSGSLLMIQHRTGVEHRWPYIGYFTYLATPPVTLAIANRESEYLDGLALFDAPKVQDGRAVVAPEKSTLLAALSAHREAIRSLPLPKDMNRVPPPI